MKKINYTKSTITLVARQQIQNILKGIIIKPHYNLITSSFSATIDAVGNIVADHKIQRDNCKKTVKSTRSSKEEHVKFIGLR